MEFRLRRKGGPPVLGGMPTRNREDLALCTLRKAPIRMVRKHPGIGAKLPTWRLTTRNSALMAAWLLVIKRANENTRSPPTRRRSFAPW